VRTVKRERENYSGSESFNMLHTYGPFGVMLLKYGEEQLYKNSEAEIR